MKLRWSVLIFQMLLLAAVYPLAAKCSYLMTFPGSRDTAMWLPKGLALAALLIGGGRLWPGIFVGALLTVILYTRSPGWVNLSVATANTLEIWVGYRLMLWAGFDNGLNRLRDVVALVLFGVVVSTTLGAFLGAMTFAMGGLLPWSVFGQFFGRWWLGEATSVLLMTPLILIAVQPWPKTGRRSLLEFLVLMAVLGFVSYSVFFHGLGFNAQRYRVPFLVFPVVVWSCIKFGQRGSILAVTLVAAFAVPAAIHNLGPLVLEGEPSMVPLRSFLATLALTALVLSALMGERDTAEATAGESETRFRTVAETLAVPLVIISREEARILYANEPMAKLFGRGREELEGALSLGFYVHENDREEIITRLNEEGRIDGLEVEVRGADGVRIVEVASRIIQFGGKMASISAFHDLTVRKRAEMALQESEERFRAISDGTTDGVLVNENGIIKDGNHALATMWGGPLEELVGLPVLGLVAEQDRGKLLEMVGTGSEAPYEITGIRKDGSTFPAMISGKTVMAMGRPTRIASIQDLTGQRRSEEALRESEERYALVAQGANEGIWDVNLETGEVYFSDRLKEMLGMPLDEPPPSLPTWGSWVHPDDREMVLNAIYHHVKQRRIHDVEFRSKNFIGEYRWFRARGQAIWNEAGRATRLAGSYGDITARKQADSELVAAKEAAEAASRSKSEFLATMSHEIRTPMNAIIGMNFLLSRTGLDEDQAELAETVGTAAKSLMAVLNDILDISKIDAGQLELEEIPFDVRGIGGEVRDLFSTQAAQKGLAFAVDLDPALPPLMLGDPQRLRQVLVNLVGNALKFTERGAVMLRLEFDVPARRLNVSAEDTGIGIPPEKMGRLFDKFTQVDASITRRYGGTGLGLAISKQLVALMGGDLGVTSVHFEGSVFHFSIPVREPGSNVELESGQDRSPSGSE